MPSKNTVKIYAENTYFHVYNRGVEKRLIFNNKKDCAVFLNYLKLYLSPAEELKNEMLFGNMNPRFLNLNLESEVDLLAFALMPNHFHLLLKQNSIDGITKLLKRASTAYVMYFNKRYNRVGPLFQGIFKACPIDNDNYLLHLSRYIHLNPRKLKLKTDYGSFSSYPNYLGTRQASWIKPHEILEYFKTQKDAEGNIEYKEFIESYVHDTGKLPDALTLEDSCF